MKEDEGVLPERLRDECGAPKSAAPEAERGERTVPTTCIETIGGDPSTALRLSFQIKVF